jgi:hypothetical protein
MNYYFSYVYYHEKEAFIRQGIASSFLTLQEHNKEYVKSQIEMIICIFKLIIFEYKLKINVGE